MLRQWNLLSILCAASVCKKNRGQWVAQSTFDVLFLYTFRPFNERASTNLPSECSFRVITRLDVLSRVRQPGMIVTVGHSGRCSKAVFRLLQMPLKPLAISCDGAMPDHRRWLFLDEIASTKVYYWWSPVLCARCRQIRRMIASTAFVDE